MHTMPLAMRAVLLSVVAACVPPIAVAQSTAGPIAHRPEGSRAPVPPLIHESPFARYRPLTENPVGSWKAANDEVGRIGGWKVYAREAGEADAPAISVETPAQTSSPAPAQRPGSPVRHR